MSSTKSKRNSYLDIHHSDTTKILEHVAASLENHKRQLNEESDSIDEENHPHKSIYIDHNSVLTTREVVITKISNTPEASSHKMEENPSQRKDEPQNLSVERSISTHSPVIEPEVKTNVDKVLNVDVASSKSRTSYFSPKDRIKNYEQQMSQEAKSNELKLINFGETKPFDGVQVGRTKHITPELTRSKSNQNFSGQGQMENMTKPSFNYETYLKQRQLLNATFGNSDKSVEQYEKKIKSTTVIPGVEYAPPPAHDKNTNISLPQASLNFPSKNLGLSQVQAAEKYKDIQLQQYYGQHHQTYNDNERFILKQSSAASSDLLANTTRGFELNHPPNVRSKKDSKPIKKQSRVSDKSLDATNSRMSLQDQQKEYLKWMQKNQYNPNDSKAMTDTLKSPKPNLGRMAYEDQRKYQNYQHHAPEEALREQKRQQQMKDQRVALQNYQEQQRYELEQLQLKQQAQLRSQHKGQQNLPYGYRHTPLSAPPAKPTGVPSTSSARSKELHYSLPGFNKQDTRRDPVHQYDLTQHIKTQEYQHPQSRPSSAMPGQQYQQSQQPSSAMPGQQYQQSQQPPSVMPGQQYQQSTQLAESIRRQQSQDIPRIMNEQQRHQHLAESMRRQQPLELPRMMNNEQQLAESMRRQQELVLPAQEVPRIMNEQQRHQQFAENMRRQQPQELPRLNNEQQKSQPVKKRQYTPAPSPLQVSSVLSLELISTGEVLPICSCSTSLGFLI